MSGRVNLYKRIKEHDRNVHDVRSSVWVSCQGSNGRFQCTLYHKLGCIMSNDMGTFFYNKGELQVVSNSSYPSNHPWWTVGIDAVKRAVLDRV